MDWDEMKPKPKVAITLGEDLSALSLAELSARVAALTDEITRVEAEAARKRAHEAAAASLFKKG
jgi:uncharacterized small protein (DUF1192 family)